MIKLFSTLCFALAIFCSVYSAEGAILSVTKTADTNDGVCDADCSLREAIGVANTTPANDIVIFALPFFSSPQTITLSGSELVAMNNGALTIAGPGAYRLTISGNNTSRIIRSVAGATVTLSGMRLTGGNGVSSVNNNSGGAILNDAGNMSLVDLIVTNNTTSGTAGGIRNSGTNSLMTVFRCIIANNTSTGSSAGGIQNFSTSTLTVVNSTFTGNVSGGGTVGGGGMQVNGAVSITNSTFYGNTSNTTGGGGAINSNGSLLLLTNVTITGNSSTGNGGGLHRGTTNPNGFIRNSIIAGNNGSLISRDVTNSAGGLVSQGNNIIGAVGTSTGWIMSDQQNVDPLLTPIGFHGGFGMTHMLLSGSPAINMGQNCVLDLTCAANNPPTTLTFDQRGTPRPFGGTVDVGAVEASGDYYAVLPSAAAGVPYSFTLLPANEGFTYSLNSGNFGGLALTSVSSTTLTGTAPVPGTFNALVHITGGPGQAFQNYRINVLSDPNTLHVTGRVLTSTGIPVSKAYVSVVGFDDKIYRGLTNPFGYFRIDSIPAGINGSLEVSKKGLDFNPQPIAVTDVIENIEIRAIP